MVVTDHETATKFVYSETVRYPSPGPIFYKSNKVQYGREWDKLFLEAHVETRVNGPGTAYARVVLSVEWASNLHWGISINRHLLGKRAGQRARAWCNYMLKNPPSSWEEWDKPQTGENRSTAP